MKKDTGGNAFPLPLGTANMSEPAESGGMTLRDYFAAKVLPEVLNAAWRHEWDYEGYDSFDDMISVTAYNIADAMLKARNA